MKTSLLILALALASCTTTTTTAPDGTVLLHSQGTGNPRDAGQAIKRLQSEGSAALADLQSTLAPIADRAALEQALAQLLAAAE